MSSVPSALTRAMRLRVVGEAAPFGWRVVNWPPSSTLPSACTATVLTMLPAFGSKPMSSVPLMLSRAMLWRAIPSTEVKLPAIIIFPSACTAVANTLLPTTAALSESSVPGACARAGWAAASNRMAERATVRRGVRCWRAVFVMRAVFGCTATAPVPRGTRKQPNEAHCRLESADPDPLESGDRVKRSPSENSAHGPWLRQPGRRYVETLGNVIGCAYISDDGKAPELCP